MAEEQCVAVLEVRLDVLGEDLGLGGVRGQQHDHVGPLGGLRVGLDLEAGFARLVGGLGAFAQADDHLDAGFAQVLRVGVALGTVSDDGDLLALDQGQVCIVVVEHVDCHVYVTSFIL